MKPRASLPICIAIALLVAACGSTSDPADDPCANGSCGDGGVVVRDSGAADGSVRDSGVRDSGTRVCAPRCQTDFDCSSTCPTTSTQCCDAPSGTCYASQPGTCVHTPDAGNNDSGGLPYP